MPPPVVHVNLDGASRRSIRVGHGRFTDFSEPSSTPPSPTRSSWRNPCRVRGAGQDRSAERPVATMAEVTALADVIEPRWRALILLAAWCGLRRGELLALRRKDIDLVHGILTVERSVQHLRGGEVILGPPKTAGRRRVVMPPHLLPERTTTSIRG